MQDLQARFATLSTEHTAGRVDQVVKAALAAGKLVPAQEAWARDFGAKDLTALSSYLNVAPPIAALAGTQTGGKGGAEGGEVAALSADQMQMCKAFGISVEDYCKTMKADADAKATA
jgi:phage I-like protein